MRRILFAVMALQLAGCAGLRQYKQDTWDDQPPVERAKMVGVWLLTAWAVYEMGHFLVKGGGGDETCTGRAGYDCALPPQPCTPGNPDQRPECIGH